MKRIGAFVVMAGLALTGPAREVSSLFEPGRIAVGCNYWASHAGMYMWRDWKPQQVEADFDRLAAHGMKVLRVFPLWPDFQPLTADFACHAHFRGWSQADGPLRNEAAVDDEMIARFRFMCDAAEKRNLKLVVGLITGWMSGRLFAPPCLAFKDPITDADAVMWETRFVRYFVNALKDHPAIAAWDLGNECDCLGDGDAAQFRNWMLTIANTIRAADPTRLVVSGMHSISNQAQARRTMRNQADTIDVLTTHPYPLWTPHCNTEPFDTIRNCCHAACETTYYANLSGKPAFVEEAGSMGPGIISEERAAATMRASLFNCWACGLGAYVWWCAFDQNKLEFAPYDWTSIERELGLFRADGTPKPTVVQMRDFAAFLKTLPFEKLPARQVDATVIVSEREEFWKVAQGAWLLAVQAGFDIRYALAESPLPESNFYILPSGTGYETYSGAAWRRVLAKAEAGATVLITLGNGAVLSELERVAGVRVEWQHRGNHAVEATVDGTALSVPETHVRKLTLAGAERLAADRDGDPFLTVHPYGKGRIVYCNAAIERNAELTAWPVYARAAKIAGVTRRVTRDNPLIGLTEHPRADGSAVVVAVNYSPKAEEARLTLEGRLGDVYRGDVTAERIVLPPNEAAVFTVQASE